jgi:hypothetical protein
MRTDELPKRIFWEPAHSGARDEPQLFLLTNKNFNKWICSTKVHDQKMRRREFLDRHQPSSTVLVIAMQKLD